MRIERLVLLRILPYLKKEVDWKNQCVVGTLTLQEWEYYISRKVSAVKQSTVKNLSTKLNLLLKNWTLLKKNDPTGKTNKTDPT